MNVFLHPLTAVFSPQLISVMKILSSGQATNVLYKISKASAAICLPEVSVNAAKSFFGRISGSSGAYFMMKIEASLAAKLYFGLTFKNRSPALKAMTAEVIGSMVMEMSGSESKSIIKAMGGGEMTGQVHVHLQSYTHTDTT